MNAHAAAARDAALDPVAAPPLMVATVHPSSMLRAGPSREDAHRAFVRDLRGVAPRLASIPS